MDSTIVTLFETMNLMIGRSPIELPLDTVFIFSRAKGDWKGTSQNTGILETAANLHNQGMTRSISLPNTPEGATFEGGHRSTTHPGPEVHKQYLEALGVHLDILLTPLVTAIHTRGESDALVSMAMSKGWLDVGIVVNPHQGLRAMLATLKSLQLERADRLIRVQPIFPSSVDWLAPVFGRQGRENLPRHQHIKDELQAVFEEQEKGYLASFEELKDYLLWSLQE